MVEKETWEKIVKVVNVLCGVFLAVVGILRFVFREDSSFLYYILAVYLMIFATMVILAALRVSKFSMFFTFLRGFIGIGFFLLFCAFLLFDWNRPVEFSCCIFLLVSMFFNWFIGCRKEEAK